MVRNVGGAWDDHGVDEKRYQVFVSSTYTDLGDERTAVIQSIQRMDHIPAGMELFPAADESQWDLIKQVIDQSDYYVVVVAGRYGSVTAEGISYTEKEYDHAVESGIPVLGFVHDDPDSIPSGKSELDKEAQELLANFRDKVKGKPVNFFTTPESLAGLVVTSLLMAIKKNPRPGWVRGDKAMTLETEKEILDLRQELEMARAAKVEAERTLFADASELAQGTDIVELRYRVKHRAPDEYAFKNLDFDVRVTWDEIFGSIGPVLIDEATVMHARDRCKVLFNGRIPKKVIDQIPTDSNTDTVMFADSWEVIEFQLRALGLIETGEKKRTVQDKNKYLKLSEKGLRHLAVVRAIKRPESDSFE
ncbi:DUF4062 domain-containing protein [Gordonia alkaliphila]|uniref:DUF4062 domain-containing protein n=2 Tax=Gordonia alkaliphila TaxID=1053547 RepID=A0ABP8ZIE4_9ACTN